MWEIFIPEYIFTKINMNTLSNDILELLKNNFKNIKIINFKSNYCIWKHITIQKIDQEFISLLNGELWEFYFIDYDFLQQDLISSGTKILKPEDITKNITKISWEFESIIYDLSWKKLLTNSKKIDIQNKINKAFFTISGILYLLYALRDKTCENQQELRDYTWVIELEAQANLIWESAKTKKIELTAQIEMFENKSRVFFETIQKIFL